MTTLADEMKAHALESQRFSRKHFVLELDFSENSMQALENQMDSVGYAIRGGKSPENIAMLTRIWGAYVGESLRKATGAEWVEELAGDVRRIGLKGANKTVHPHEQVHLRLNGTAANSLVKYFQEAREQLNS